MIVYVRLETKENLDLLALKVVAVAYERWSLTRGSKYSDLTWKLLGFWKTFACKRWSQPEVRLYKYILGMIFKNTCMSHMGMGVKTIAEHLPPRNSKCP